MHSSLQGSPTELDLLNLKFMVYGCKQASKHTHARVQCSHASVGLTQARPNYCHSIIIIELMKTISWWSLFSLNLSWKYFQKIIITHATPGVCINTESFFHSSQWKKLEWAQEFMWLIIMVDAHMCMNNQRFKSPLKIGLDVMHVRLSCWRF